MADAPEQKYPDLEIQRQVVQQHLNEWRETNLRAQLRIAALSVMTVGIDKGIKAKQDREVKDLQLNSANAEKAIVVYEAEMKRVEAEIKVAEAAEAVAARKTTDDAAGDE